MFYTKHMYAAELISSDTSDGDVKENIGLRKGSAATFIDFRETFNGVSHATLVKKLKKRF